MVEPSAARGSVISASALATILLAAAAYHLITGALALFWPDTFFDEIGRYGVENSHYVGDAGAFTFAYGLALLLAAARPAWRAPILYVGALWYAVHAFNHLFDIDEARSDARGIFDTGALAIGAVLLAWFGRISERLAREPAAAPGGRP
jgi:hypothetical protein